MTPRRSADSGEWRFDRSSGGLVSAFLGVHNMEILWVGWVGVDVPPEEREEVTSKLAEQTPFPCYPVYLDSETADLFYNGFCNNVLWPLLHYIPLSMLDSQVGPPPRRLARPPTLLTSLGRAHRLSSPTTPHPCSARALRLLTCRLPACLGRLPARLLGRLLTGEGSHAAYRSLARSRAQASVAELQWKAYQKANALFADSVCALQVRSPAFSGLFRPVSTHPHADLTTALCARQMTDNDMVWVQDYHLMLLPRMLRERSEQMSIGWFLHTPFATAEMYRTLPHREEILRGVLGADLVGFHIYDYARHFHTACSRVVSTARLHATV